MATRTIGLAVALALACTIGGEPAWAREPVNVRAEFSKFDPDYKARIAPWRKQVEALQKAVFGLEAAGQPSQCAAQALAQLSWRTSNTADYRAIEADAARAADFVAHPGPATGPETQDPADGAWGRCQTEWFFRLSVSYEAIEALDDVPPAVAPRFLDRVNDPAALEAYLTGLAVSDIAHQGINGRRELNESLSNLMRLILRDQPAGYAWHPGMKAKIMALINGPLRDPDSRFWGASYRIDGKQVFVPDLSITFHVVRYLKGDITDWPRVLDTLIEIRDLPYPQGWRQEDGYINHDIYDVAALFRLGWAHADDAQRDRIRSEVERLLDWSLAHTFTPDGAVVVSENDDSAETAYYFAVSFLDSVGYFDKSKRFWTDRDFPEAAALATKLRTHIQAGLASGTSAEGGAYYRGALEKLDSQ